MIYAMLGAAQLPPPVCHRAAVVVALLALLWAVGTLWVLGQFYGDLDEGDDA